MRRPGFTLLELVLSMAVIAVLMAATQAVVTFAARATGGASSTTEAVLDCSVAANVLLNELRYAIAVTELTSSPSAGAVTFTVADRDGNGTPETIRYSWAGPGTPLRRTYNGTAVDVLAGVQEFSLARETRAVTASPMSSYGSEGVLWSYVSNSNLASESINSGNFYGQYLKPSLSASAAAWKITRVKFVARSNGPVTGQTIVQIRDVSGSSLPTSILQEATLMENTLSTGYQWVEVPFNVVELSPSRGVCVTFKWFSGVDSCDLLVQGSGSSSVGGRGLRSTDLGNNWAAQTDQDMQIMVYGRVRTPDAPQTQTLLTGVRVNLRSSSNAVARVSQTVMTLNEPDVSGI